MALGRSSRAHAADNDNNIDMAGDVPTIADEASPSGSPYDPEKLGRSGSGRNRMARIADPLPGLAPTDTDSDSDISVRKLVEAESNNSIKYRTCSWPKTAALLFSEYICLAIMSFPWSYANLGLFPGILFTFVIAAVVLYTSLVIWEFCLRHPEVRDVCDIGQMLFWGKKWAWYLTAVMFLLNNTFIQGLHVLTGAEYLNTISNHGACTVAFSAVCAIACFVVSLPRTFSTLAKLASASAFFTFVSVILAAIFSGIEPHPTGYDTGVVGTTEGLVESGEPIVSAFPPPGTTYVAGMNAFLNISYTFIGQITIPSFIAEMKNPADFPKALWAVTIAEVIVFSLVGSIVYVYTGQQYMQSPAFGALGDVVYKKVAFSFMVPTILFLGVLYASVSARFLFFRLFDGTRHKTDHTVVGWATWAGILAVTWVVAFIIAEVIPFFSDLLSLMSSLFDSFFGFIFWGVAWIRMRKADYGPGWYGQLGVRGQLTLALNVCIILTGCYFLTAGTYASVDAIVMGYQAGNFGGVFTCADNGL